MTARALTAWKISVTVMGRRAAKQTANMSETLWKDWTVANFRLNSNMNTSARVTGNTLKLKERK